MPSKESRGPAVPERQSATIETRPQPEELHDQPANEAELQAKALRWTDQIDASFNATRNGAVKKLMQLAEEFAATSDKLASGKLSVKEADKANDALKKIQKAQRKINGLLDQLGQLADESRDILRFEAKPLVEQLAQHTWKAMDEEEKLTFLEPAQVKGEMAISLYLAHEPAREALDKKGSLETNREAIMRNVRTLIAAYVEAGYIDEKSKKEKPYSEKIANSVEQYVGFILEAVKDGSLKQQPSAEAVNAIAEDIVKKMVYQNEESEKRALGDHGVRHIIDGNITEALKMIEQFNAANPGHELTAADKVKMMTIHFNHDMGYTVSVNRKGFDSAGNHPLFSRKLFEADAELYGALFDEKELFKIAATIESHDKAGINFRHSPLESIVRLSDNLGLFYDAKLPEVFYRQPENVVILQKIFVAKQTGVDISGLINELKANIRNGDFDHDTKKNLLNAAGELNDMAPKFNLGMFAGKLDGYEFDGTKAVVRLRKSDMHAQIQQLFNLNQKQFVKLLNIYQVDLDKLRTTFDKFVKTGKTPDGQEYQYIDLPPDEKEARLRFEFLPENPEDAPVNQEIKELFERTGREWAAINIRSEINALAAALEKTENQAPDRVLALIYTLESNIDPTNTQQDRLTAVDFAQLQAITENLLKAAASNNQTDFANAQKKLRAFTTSQERTFLRSPSA